MHTFKALRGAGAAACLAAGVLLATTSGAMALKLCVPNKEGATIKTPKAGVCTAAFTLTELGAEGKEGLKGVTGAQGPVGATGAEGKDGLKGVTGAQGPAGATGAEGKQGKEGGFAGLSEAEQKTLRAILPYIKYVAAGVGGKPTIQVSAANLQILSGSGSTNGSVNGAGNLIIGYGDEGPYVHRGSHNLILGDNAYCSYGSIVGGQNNEDSGAFSDVFGQENENSGAYSDVVGFDNFANSAYSFVSGSGGGVRPVGPCRAGSGE